jgi:hypothetical protein
MNIVSVGAMTKQWRSIASSSRFLAGWKLFASLCARELLATVLKQTILPILKDSPLDYSGHRKWAPADRAGRAAPPNTLHRMRPVVMLRTESDEHGSRCWF